MNQLSLRRLALNAASITGGFAGIVAFLLASVFGARSPLLIAFISIFAVGGFTWVVFLYFVRNFIDKRIRALYKTIYNVKLDDNSTFNLPESDDMIMLMQREVTDWMKNRSTEIEDLKKLEHYRREFLGNVSHELKTPVFNIQGYVTTLLDGGLEDPNINRNYLLRTEKSVERMINIIDDLEAISRLESGEMILEKDVFDIVDLARDVFEGQEMRSRERKIQLKFRENYKPHRVNADKDRIRQVLTNLTVNSIKYGKEGGETEIRFYDMDDHILVEVSDNGIGIAKEHLPRLFERFYRVDKGRSREQGGTGLGLAIVKHILEAHGQSINVRSSEGVGSTFSFTLPKGK
jgi:two-component system, OmpR family, phosphate regulon sensor histidine kinase PhoR